MTTPATPDAREPRPDVAALTADECATIADKALRCVDYPTGTRDIAQLYATLAQLRRDVDALAPAPALVPAAAVDGRCKHCGDHISIHFGDKKGCIHPRLAHEQTYYEPVPAAAGEPRVGDTWSHARADGTTTDPIELVGQDYDGAWRTKGGVRLTLRSPNYDEQHRWSLVSRTPEADVGAGELTAAAVEAALVAKRIVRNTDSETCLCSSCENAREAYQLGHAAGVEAERVRERTLALRRGSRWRSNVLLDYALAHGAPATCDDDEDVCSWIASVLAEHDTARADLARERAEVARWEAGHRTMVHALTTALGVDAAEPPTGHDVIRWAQDLRADLAAARGERDRLREQLSEARGNVRGPMGSATLLASLHKHGFGSVDEWHCHAGLCDVADAVFGAPAQPAAERAPVEPREPVQRFALLMEAKLAANDHKGHWDTCDNAYLMRRLRQEVDEISTALRKRDPVAIAAECADVANFAMMVADNCGGLEPPAAGPGEGGEHA